MFSLYIAMPIQQQWSAALLISRTKQRELVVEHNHQTPQQQHRFLECSLSKPESNQPKQQLYSKMAGEYRVNGALGWLGVQYNSAAIEWAKLATVD